jgi:hypothetical protein
MAGLTVNVLELNEGTNPSTGYLYVIIGGVDYKITFENLDRFNKRVQLTLTSSSLIGGVFTFTHNLVQAYPSAIALYDNANKKVPDANYEFTSISTNTGSIEIFQPITGIWKLVLRY